MFTKQHYESVASILSAAHADSAIDDGARTVLHNLTQKFADYFEQDNELFARRAFIGACNAASRSQIRRLVAQSNNKKAGKPTPDRHYQKGQRAKADARRRNEKW